MEEIRDVKCHKCHCYRTANDFLKEGRQMKTCSFCRRLARNYARKSKCEHGRRKYQCITCEGSAICEHNCRKVYCKICANPVKVTIKRWILNSRAADKKYNRYDADRFIDKCFLKGLVEDTKGCYYCQKKMQYMERNDNMATLERIDNKIGHVKSNCVICCLLCNCRHNN